MTDTTIDMAATPGFAAWLDQRAASVAFTSYRAGKLITLGAGQGGALTASDCSLSRCMGLGLAEGRLWAASQHQLWRFDNILSPGQRHGDHDAVFLPVQSVLTGAVDIHDIVEDGRKHPIFAVPRFNCLATVAEAHSFEVLWKPSFITDIVAEDRCHLNGLATMEGAPRFVTCIATTNTSGAWRDQRIGGGVVIDVQSGEVVASGLSMPHSPRLYDGKLWIHQSGTGEFGHVNLQTGMFEPLVALPGFPRGLAFHDKWAVIGLSKPREDSGFDGLPIGDRLARDQTAAQCAIIVFNLETGEVDYQVEIGTQVEEIYDIGLIKGIRNPKLVDPDSDDARYFIRPKISDSRG
jgi:uncharacterized protein (TIGR03032 family)